MDSTDIIISQTEETKDSIEETIEEKIDPLSIKVPKTLFSKVNYDTLVLSGGGSKGILTIGALQYAYDNFLLQDITNYVGTSSGAIICFLLAIGYTPVEIVVYICTNQLMEKMQHFNVVAMINGGGASSYNNIQEQLEKMTISKLGYLPTLLDLQNTFNKTLTFVTYNLTKGKVEYLSPETYPNLPCITALRLSSNLPLVFDKYKYGNDFYIDGGVIDNFAIDVGDSIGEKILGIKIDSDINNFSKDLDINILEYIYKLMFIPIAESDRMKIENISSKCTVIKLKFSKLTFFDFSINSKTKLDIFSSGYDQFQKAHS